MASEAEAGRSAQENAGRGHGAAGAAMTGIISASGVIYRVGSKVRSVTGDVFSPGFP